MITKKINETPMLEQATAETNVLVEQNGTASRIPASALGGGSEKALVEKLAPAFTKTGAVVTCNPVEGYPLEVVSHIQAGVKDFIPADAEWSDEFVICQGMLLKDVPAGEYTLEVACEGEIGVWTYNGDRDQLIGTVEPEFDDISGVAIPKEFTFTHSGGDLLLCNESWSSVYGQPSLTGNVAEYSSVALTHNGKTINTELPRAVSNGSFNWTTGVLAVLVGSGDNLIPVNLEDSSNWSYDEDSGFYSYEMDLPEGEYTIHVNVALYLDFTWMVNVNGDIKPMTEYLNDTSFTFYHNGGTVSFVETNGITGHVEIVEAEHFEYHQLAPHEILGLAGVNTLFSNTGDTEVSGRANPAAVFAEQEARIAALEAALSKE